LGIEKVAIFVENTDWGRATGDQLKATFDNYYPEYDLVSVYLIEVGQTDFYSVLSELKPLDPDFLFISLTGTSAAIITRQIREVGIGAYICGLSGDFDTDTYAELCGESLRGVTIAHMFHPDGNAEAGTFYDEYVARWPDKPPGSYAAECYAGAVVLFEAIERAGSTDPEAIRTELRKTNRQTVLIKPVKFDPVYQNSPINELFVQWVAIGERGIIWPEESKTMDPIKGPFA
ncbi:MAG: ABC transporter substrate-binding protein, partial [Candidatus Hodarchaeota archaeon]